MDVELRIYQACFLFCLNRGDFHIFEGYKVLKVTEKAGYKVVKVNQKSLWNLQPRKNSFKVVSGTFWGVDRQMQRAFH